MKFSEFAKQQPEQVAEAAKLVGHEYESSIDFQEDLDQVKAFLTSAEQILKSPQWKEWMKATEENFEVSVIHTSENIANHLEKALNTLESLNDELDKAS